MIEIQVLNDFYTSLISRDFKWVTERNTRRILSGLGIKMSANGSGIKLFVEVDGTGKLVHEQQSMPVKLVFYMALNNPLFYNFSNLPLDLNHSKIFYFSNKASNKREVFSTGSDSLLLNQSEQVSSTDLMKVKKEVYSFVLSGNDGTKTANLVSLDSGTTVLSQEQDPVDNHYNFSFQMDGLNTGRYKLDIGGVEQDRFFFSADLSMNRYFAVVELFSDTDSDYAYFNLADELTSKDYSIAFNRRSTFWRYKVHNRNGLDLPDPQIREAENPWDFSVVEDNVFTSNIAMPLKEAPIAGITLKGNKNDEASILIDNLPNPDPSLIKPDPGDPTTIYSDIYVYL